jgi:hypothetical protein
MKNTQNLIFAAIHPAIEAEAAIIVPAADPEVYIS